MERERVVRKQGRNSARRKEPIRALDIYNKAHTQRLVCDKNDNNNALPGYYY